MHRRTSFIVAFAFAALSACSQGQADSNDGGAGDLATGSDAAMLPPPGVSGPWIAFTSIRAGTFDIYLVHPDGTGLQTIIQSAGADELPAWSPDGSKIVFSSDRTGAFQLYTYDLTTGQETAIATGLDSASNASWSPDGTRLALVGGVAGSNGLLWVVPATGGTATPITTGAFRDSSPVWAADGSKIYFTSDRSKAFEVWSVQPDGSNLIQVTSGSGLIGGAALSPDGQLFAFALGTMPTPVVLYSLATKMAQMVSANGDSEPAFSPDGKQLAVTSIRYAVDNPEIVVLDPTGAAAPFRLTDSPGIDGQAAFQPR